MVLVVSMVIALLGGIGLSGSATAADQAPSPYEFASPQFVASGEWIVLCTGYSGCNAAGYSDSGYSSVSSTSYWRQSTGHNCTNYVAYRMVRGGMPNTRPASLTGYASNWGPSFASQTNSTPAVGSIAWWDTSYSSTGHVAYVEKVISNDEVLVSEDNWGGDFRWRKVTRSGGRWPQGFIHLNDVGTPPAGSQTGPRAFEPLPTPGRLVDTRSGVGVAAGAVSGGTDATVQVTGRGGVPASGVGSVVLNVTTFGGATPGWVTAYASGAALPDVRSTSWFGSYYTNNEVLVKVGSDGRIKLRPSSDVGMVVDVVGWLPPAAWLTTTAPTRIADTRSGLGVTRAQVSSGGTIDVPVAGRGGVPSTGAVAAVLSVTAPKRPGSGWVAAWAAGTTRPAVADLRLVDNTSTTGLVTSLIGAGGKVSLYTTATTDLVVDVVGWVPADSDVRIVRPVRALDTRGSAPVTGGTSVRSPFRGVGDVPDSGVVGALVSITSSDSTASGALIAYPSGTTRPGAGTTHFTKGQTVTTLAVLPVGPDGGISVYTSRTSDVIVDVHGYVRG
ncbi:MAG: hypothetical protein JWP82_1744 [Humibacillus sp.]|nr:hypothetical protein [Humibacillus sp.]